MASTPRPVAGVTLHDPEKAWPGYTLFCQTHQDRREPERRFTAPLQLIDMEGRIMHRWYTTHPVQLLKLAPDGTLFTMTRDRSRIEEAGVRRLAPDSTELWHYHCRVDHDYYPLADGHMMIHTIVDHMVPALGNGLRRNPYIIEIDTDDNLVWEWHGDQHLAELAALVDLRTPIDFEAWVADQAARIREWNPALQAMSPTRYEDYCAEHVAGFAFDWAHNNTCQVIEENAAAAVDPRFRPGNIVFSYRTLDIIGVIDRDSGEIVWAWGPGEIDGQHKPHMLPNGHILIYDNGTCRGWSRIVELDPLTNEIVWQYAADPKEDFFSAFISGAQRLPNGNTLICEGAKGRLFEVTMDGEVVWEYVSPFRGVIDRREVHNIYRATRYSEAHAGALLGA